MPTQTCQCGCGAPVESGRRFCQGHNPKRTSSITDAERQAHRQLWDGTGIPYGFCLCGCGRFTSISPGTWRHLSILAGEPVRYIRGHATTRKTLYTVEDRGYRSRCWIVTGYLQPEGYGRMVDDKGKQRPAHIVMWEREHGPVPKDLQLDHLCRQPSCIRPTHLEAVTNAENVRRSGTARLTHADVAEIRGLLKAGELTHRQIALRFCVCAATVSHISSGRNWRT